MEGKKKNKVIRIIRFLIVVVAFGVLFYQKYCRERAE